MDIQIHDTPADMGAAAAAQAARAIHRAIEDRGEAYVIVATGASQFEVLKHLIDAEVDWSRVTFFHLDEYVGLPIKHPASFRLYLWQRLHRKLPLPPRAFHYLDGEHDAKAEAQRVGRLIADVEIDVALIGIGENAHIAFNDPPADFDTEEPYLVVELDHACRNQQFGEGWFDRFEDVPTHAISMSVKQILKSKQLIVSVPDERKAEAVKATVEGPVTHEVPASILQRHDATTLMLDTAAASKLESKTVT